ncbi:hypothetical protein [Pseudonocardia sp. NPDC049154]|uniref:hypothetical protein n=1 Tax=Pseudonocardia sp. NPDC049154 TaxID=3155501 RepID=UPI0034062D73
MTALKKATAIWSAHGVAAVLEWPNSAAEIRRNTIGTILIQEAGTHNWIHLPVPAAGWLSKRVEQVIGFGLRAECNENARIDLVRLVDSGRDFGNGDTPSYQDEVGFLGEAVWYTKELPEMMNWYSGRVISIHVDFLSGSPRGRIEFRGGDIYTKH